MTDTPATLVAQRAFAEAPRWHEGRLWFSDVISLQVFSAAEDGSDLRLEATVPGEPAGIDWLPDGRLVVVSRQERRLMRREHDGTLVVHGDLQGHAIGFCNEVLVDRQGRAYVGNFGFDLDQRGPLGPSVIHRVDLDGTVTQVAEDLWFPNGCVLTPDGVFLVAETFGNRVSAFDLTEDGRLVGRRTWAAWGALPTATTLDEALSEFVVEPDGMCMDAEGALWIADLASARLLRVLEGGRVVDSVDAGMTPFSAALGGADGHTMFICAAPYFDDLERRGRLLSEVLSVRVPVPVAGASSPTLVGDGA
ncbi:SMP-30/gluconolactonase/LRE family protein [Modestobacter sp. Leaf380]|uniref:SMP-30/gluconolactonase/LRE family protein n=1 Tax=Modestobacter sp. Leaf380 TaxID=1736356 RepID=UPI0006FC518D|nr:SMP-30/gluconolactonase/LRE family protein [Modestobacter sp. Leaf380]KQS64253.1 gluconolactonase [Modestobacter sp. Leaf380]